MLDVCEWLSHFGAREAVTVLPFRPSSALGDYFDLGKRDWHRTTSHTDAIDQTGASDRERTLVPA